MDLIHGSDPWIRSMDLIHGTVKKVEKSKRSETIWNHWKPSETIGNPSETFGKPQKPLETLGNLKNPSKDC